MATTNISTEIVSITGVTAHGASDDFIVSGQKFVVASVPKNLLKWATTFTVPGNHGGNTSDGVKITMPIGTDSILDVSRNGFSATEVPYAMKGFIANTSSLHLATNTYPKYYLDDTNPGEGSRIIVKPIPTDSETAIALYVDYTKIDDDCDLRNAVIYHACSSELSKLSTAELPTVSIAAVPPDVPTITTVTFSSTDSDLDASAPSFTTAAVAAAGVLGTTSGFNAYHPLSDFGDNDPGALTISVSAPSIAISAPGVTTTAAPTITANVPTYTPPAMSALNFGDADTWINTEEDSEMLASRMQVINGQIADFNSRIQDSLNTFNEENAKYQASIQSLFKEKDYLAAENTLEAQQTLEAAVQDASLEVQKYQAAVNDEVQEYSQKLARYQLELNTTLQAWQKEYDASIQESLQELQVSNQVNIAQGQAALQVAIDNENRSQQRQLQNGINDMQAIVASNQDLISKYQSELQQYSGEVQAEVSEYQNKIQKQQSLSKEADKYYQWAKLEVTTYIQNNSKMIAATMAGRAARAQA